MTTRVRLRNGLEVDRIKKVFSKGEVIHTKDTKQTYVGDGVTPGGVPIISNLDVVDTIAELTNVDSSVLIVYVRNTNNWWVRTKTSTTFKPMESPPVMLGSEGLPVLYLK